MPSRKEIEKYVNEYGFTMADLTPEELEKVKEEIRIIKAGGLILDGVLFGKDRYIGRTPAEYIEPK